MNLPPIVDDPGNVTALTVKRREPVRERMLTEVPPSKCRHWNASFTVDAAAGDCICSLCGERVTAMFVLEQLMKAESRWQRSREAYLGEMIRLDQRSKTKCEHCARMTRISR